MAMTELEAAYARRKSHLITSLEHGIFLGMGAAAADSGSLSHNRITHILNVADDVPRSAATEGLAYCCLNVGDFGADAGISRVFDAALAFVRPAIDSGGVVLVHCANGSNRSPTVAIALLMQLRDWPLATAYAHVASRRLVQPLADNRRELLRFEVALRGVASMEEGSGGKLVPLALDSSAAPLTARATPPQPSSPPPLPRSTLEAAMAGRMEEVVTWLDDWLECGDAKLDSSGDVVSECAAVKAKDALEGSQGCVSEWFHIDSRVEARCQECREMTLLIAASMGGQKALVARLLERCRSAPARLKMTGMRDADGYTALMWAAERGEFGVVAALLKAGALTDPPWPSGAELQASPSSEAPLSSEAKAVSTQGTYPLISTETAPTFACKLGHASIVFALVRAGASTSAVDGDGASALECVARRGHVAAAKALISKQQLSSNDPHALGALIVAAMRGHGAMVELLLLSGLEADALDGNGLSARSAARMEGREEVLAVIDGVDRLKREASS